MKRITRLITTTAICAASLIALRAAPLTGDTPVYASPDFTSPVLVTLGAGAEPAPTTAASAVALPEGWQAIGISASLDVWVRDSDLNKELDVKPGSALRAEPNPESASMGTMVAGDATELRGIQGKWVQMHISKKTTGYINPTRTAPTQPQIAATTASTTASFSQPATPAPAVTTTASAPETVQTTPYAAGQTAAPAVQQPLSVSSQQSGSPLSSGVQQPRGNTTSTTSPASISTTSVPTASANTTTSVSTGGGTTYEAKPTSATAVGISRTFEGTFASTRRAFMPRRPYDFQITAPDGTRMAYLDLSKIVVTEQLENYIGRTVIINGPIGAVPNTQDAVIRVETMQAK